MSSVRALSLLLVVGVLAGLGVAIPPRAGAEALPGPVPTQGPSGLPNGRVYEQVSPQNKHGNEAGGVVFHPPFIVTGIGGNEAVFSTSGTVGESPTGFTEYSIARREPAGWQSHSAIPRGHGTQAVFVTNPQQGLGFNSDLTATLFGAEDAYVPGEKSGIESADAKLYLYNEDGTIEWLGRPIIETPLQYETLSESPAGASPDLKTVYFSYAGILTTADQEPNPGLGGISRAEKSGGRGFYEWHDGTLESAGVLPDGRLDPAGAAPASTVDEFGYSPEVLNNQVSKDAHRAFFVSPDPGAFSAGRPIELYVRETAPDGTHTTALVSRDLLLPETGGLPAGAPDGVLHGAGNGSATYMFATPDGSRVFFESDDSLTADAPVANTVKEYEFDIRTNSLTYLQGVADIQLPCGNCTTHVVQSSQDGSNFIFDRENEVALWHDGSISKISAGTVGTVVRATQTGSDYVFESKAPFEAFGFNNGNGAYSQVYRYDVALNTLDCLSCPPVGTVATGNAELSHAFPGNSNTYRITTGNRGISEDGSRVFFDTPDPLVHQDSNGMRDAYEWDNGTVSLLTTGSSTKDSFFGDNSPNGNDVFLSTIEGLLTGDTDEGYDVYDARVPRPGDQLPPSSVACEGSVCQGPPSVPQLLGAPASELFNGAGNVVAAGSQGQSTSKSKPLTRKQKLARALKACERRKGASARKKCKSRARGRYGAAIASNNGNRKSGGDSSHRNGRGK